MSTGFEYHKTLCKTVLIANVWWFPRHRIILSHVLHLPVTQDFYGFKTICPCGTVMTSDGGLKLRSGQQLEGQ